MATRSRTPATSTPEAASTAVDLRLSARVLAVLYAAGASLTLLVVFLPHIGKVDDTALLVVVALGYVGAAGLVWQRRRVNRLVLELGLAWASTLVTAIVHFSDGRPGPFVLFYVWVVLYAAYFFGVWQLVAQIAYITVAFGALLLASPSQFSSVPAWWAAAVGTLIVGAALIQAMRARSERLIDRLCDAARTDPLTGLSNRHGFREVLDLEVERARRSSGRLAIVMAVIDGAEQPSAGHLADEVALQRIGAVLDIIKRQSDVAARVGGGEFALVLPDTDSDGAVGFVERVRQAVAVEFGTDAAPVTLSFGVASQPRHGQTAASLIRACDEALCAAEQEGGDCAVLHRPELRGLSRRGAGADIEAERYVAVMLDLAETVDLRFSGTARHSETVGRYAEMMARELGLPEHRIERVRLAGALHDIGKVGVPDSILHKPATLTDDEFATIKQHPGLGAQILEHPSLADVREWVATHHERPDGRGYPQGLEASEIALEAQIIAVADAYEAMTSDRAYRASIGREAARAELERCAGSQFDPRVVNAFLARLERDSARASTLPHAA